MPRLEAWIWRVARAVAWPYAGISAPDDCLGGRAARREDEHASSGGNDASGAQLVDDVEE